MVAEVIVDVLSSNVDRVFDYTVPDNIQVKVGQKVKVPFGSRTLFGFVIKLKDNSSYDNSKLKSIIDVDSAQPLLTENMVRLCFFMKSKFFLRLADTIRLFLPPTVRSGMQEKTVNYVFINCDNVLAVNPKKSPKQFEVLNYLNEHGQEDFSVLSKKFGASAVKGLIEKGLIKKQTKTQEASAIDSKFSVKKKNIVLNNQQQEAVEKICKSKYQTFLLHGVTGSGKTEVYINCIKNVLSQGKTAIMLVPEISLTPQMFARFKNAFGDTVAILHSSLSPRQRFDEWTRLKKGKAKIALGARSCIFAPLENIGLIVIDEEHDSSYYSESNPRFHTHEVAKYLAYLNSCPLVLGSATPSVESFYKARQKEYYLLQLTNRANNKDLPQIEIVDMLQEVSTGNFNIFSARFLKELESCLAQKKQAMIFINRRGFSSFLMCKECGYVPKCEDCDVSLVYHKDDNQLKCHYCQRRYTTITKCPHCGSSSIRFGAVGTQRVVEELKKFIDVPIFRLDNDSTKNKDSYVEILENFNNTSPSILVGTQMIAKGHDFNNVTLVGIIDADMSLHFSDYRALERTYQLITQVAGRAGRSDSEGKVVLQTYYPKHFVYRCASNYDYNAFFKKELNLREVSHFPPFVSILRVLVLSENEQLLLKELEKLFASFKQLKEEYSSDFVYLSAMKCPKKRLQKNFRYQILARIYTKNEQEIVGKIFDICDNIKATKVSVFVELDPQNLS